MLIDLLRWLVCGVGFGLGCGGVRTLESWWAAKVARRQMEQHMRNIQALQGGTLGGPGMAYNPAWDAQQSANPRGVQ